MKWNDEEVPSYILVDAAIIIIIVMLLIIFKVLEL